jgi:hypothetical protein
VSILLGVGDGSFLPETRVAVGGRAVGIATGQLDANAAVDLAVVVQPLAGRVGILLGAGNGTFATVVHYPVGDGGVGVVVSEFDGDCAQDLAVVNNVSNDLSVLLGNPAPPPWIATGLGVSKVSGSVARVAWNAAAGALGYDVVRGSVGLLASSNGDFGVATSVCVGDDESSLVRDDGDVPAAGAAYWYLVRPVDACGNGSYDSGAASQSMPRDAEILSSGFDCP